MAKKLIIALVISFLVTGSAQANLLVDTGQPSNTTGGPELVYPQTLVAQFTLNQKATINAIMGWINIRTAGLIMVLIYQDNADVPGAMVFSQGVDVTSTGAAWIGASSLNLTLTAGKYWVGFTNPMLLAQCSMPKPAPSPLAKEGYIMHWAGGGASGFVSDDDMDIGVRISGYPMGGVVPYLLLLD
jgi:hypothetical protein